MEADEVNEDSPKYCEFITRLISGASSPEKFVHDFQSHHLARRSSVDWRSFDVLERLFAAAEMYTDDPELLDGSPRLYVSFTELMETARWALSELTRFNGDSASEDRRRLFASRVLSVFDGWLNERIGTKDLAEHLVDLMDEGDAELLECKLYLDVRAISDGVASSDQSADEDMRSLVVAAREALLQSL